MATPLESLGYPLELLSVKLSPTPKYYNNDKTMKRYWRRPRASLGEFVIIKQIHILKRDQLINAKQEAQTLQALGK